MPSRKPVYKSLYVQVLFAIACGVLVGHFHPERKKHCRHGTFLWVALAVQDLQDQHVIAADMLDVLEEIPSGLKPLYDRIMKQINKLTSRNLRRCILVLSRASLAYRPLQLHEMHTITTL